MCLINNTSGVGEVHFRLAERTFGIIPEVIPSSGISTTNQVEEELLLKIRMEEVLVESREIFMIFWTHSYVLNWFCDNNIVDYETILGTRMSMYER